MRKNAGFTMIELLAAIVILGILMGVAVPTVMRVLTDSRNRTYIDDSLKLASTMDYQIRKDNMIPIPAVGSCIVMNLSYLDNNTFKDAPYGGEYDRVYSFGVALRKDVGNYEFYPRLVEKLPKGSSGYRGVNLTKTDNLYEKNAIDLYVTNVTVANLFDPANLSNLKDELSNYGIMCNSVIVYAPNAEVENAYE